MVAFATREKPSEFHFDFDRFRLILQTVESCHHISVLFVAEIVREFVHRFGGNGKDIGRRIDIDLVSFGETIDHIEFRRVHLSLGFRGSPEEIVAVGHPHGFEFARLLRGFVVDEGICGTSAGVRW